jgi:adenylate cyclase, class 2
MRNIELKARLRDPTTARQIAESIATKRLGTQHQIDTYFACRHGRLKLREINGLSAELVWYTRKDQQGPKASDYRLVPVTNPEALKAALTAALGTRVVVDKRREIFLVENVRIHLDEVAGLGQFLEFEAVLGPTVDDAAGRAQLDRLMEQFGIRSDDLLSGSYSDMLG